MLKKLFLHTSACCLVLVTLLLAILYKFWIELPDIDNPQAFIAPQSIRITDRNGYELYRILGTEDRTWIELNQLPEYVPQAFIAIEDKRFYSRSCLDIRALTRAVIANTKEFGSEGGSTITQQLVRTVFLSPEKSIDRKVREILLACELETKRSKAEILELYLNWIAFGHGISGVEQASQLYFGISASELSIAQAATLAALPQRPTYFSPYGQQKKTNVDGDLKNHLRSGQITHKNQISNYNIQLGLLGRRTRVNKRPFILEGRANEVVRKMYEQQLITAAQAAQAQNEVVDLQFAEEGYRILAPHFVFWILNQLPPSPISLSPTRIRTTLDVRFQQLVEQVVANHYPNIVEAGATNLAVVVLDTKTNEVLAYKGNVGFFSANEGQIDMAQAPRQPGSSFKPFVYAAAFMAGHTPDEIIVDEPLWIGTYKPKNYDGGYLWRMPMAVALAKSRNIPAIKTYYLAGGEEPVLRTAASLGAVTPFTVKTLANRQNTPVQFGWPLALGAVETPLLEMVNAYSSLANNGWYRPVHSILDMETLYSEQIISSNNIGYQAVPQEIADSITAALTNSENRPEGGWRNAMDTGAIAAAIKTGTSNIGKYPRDTWTIGYSDKYVIGVWVGNADGRPLQEKMNGLEVALPIWKDILLQLHALNI